MDQTPSGVGARNFDIIRNGLEVTPDRAAHRDSMPYFGFSRNRTRQVTEGLTRLGSQIQTVGVCRRPSLSGFWKQRRHRTSESIRNVESFRDLRRADRAALLDLPIAIHYAKPDPVFDCRCAVPRRFYAMACVSRTPRSAALNSGIKELVDDHTWSALPERPWARQSSHRRITSRKR